MPEKEVTDTRADTARQSYELARREALVRAKLRDTALLAFMAAAGLAYGFAFRGSHQNRNLLLLVPYLATGVAALLTQHNYVIAALGKFCTNELEPFLQKVKADAPQWESSEALKEKAVSFLMLTLIAHFLILLVPAGAALYLTSPETEMTKLAWGGGAGLTVLTCVLLFCTVADRIMTYLRYKCQNRSTDIKTS